METITAVSREVAQQEVIKWLDFKKMSEKKRDRNAESIESLINSVEDGVLSLNPETFEWKQQLLFPVGDIKELVFKPRLDVFKIHGNLSGIASTDGDGRILAYVATLTAQPSGIIRKLDTEDYAVGKNLAYFFL